MTKKQNDEHLIEVNDYNTASELNTDLDYATTDTEKAYGRTFHGDVNDYVFLNPKRSKKRVSVANDFENVSAYPLVASKNPPSNAKSHHKKRKKRKKRNKMKLWKKVLISVSCAILALILIFVATITLLINKGSKEMITNDYTILSPSDEIEAIVQNHGEYIVYNGKTYEYNENITSILCMGIDKRDIEGTNVQGTGGQADVIVLAAIDTKTGKTSLINISRDTMTDVTAYSEGGSYIGSSVQQICLSYAYGDGKKTSCENTVDSVKRLFYNIPINSYISLDLDGIAVVNDSIGGVDVTSPETIGQFAQGETYHLEGDMAESFVRSRDMDAVDANNARNKRQQVYVESFINKLITQTRQDFSTPMDLFKAASDYSCTNLNASKISFLAKTIMTGEEMSINMTNVPGTVKKGEVYAEYYVNEAEFYELFINVFYNHVS